MSFTTLSPLPAEVIALIWNYLMVRPSTNVLCTSQATYIEGARTLYTHVTLDVSVARSFFYGLGGEYGQGLGQKKWCEEWGENGQRYGWAELNDHEDANESFHIPSKRKILCDYLVTLTLLDGESARQCQAASIFFIHHAFTSQNAPKTFDCIFPRLKNLILGEPLVQEIISHSLLAEDLYLSDLHIGLSHEDLSLCVMFPEGVQPTRRALKNIADAAYEMNCQYIALHGAHPCHLVGTDFSPSLGLRVDVHDDPEEGREGAHCAQMDSVKAHCRSLFVATEKEGDM
ncbi:hypothetical protein IAT38_002658 [Cryptococcus sp. DSM 104549]